MILGVAFLALSLRFFAMAERSLANPASFAQHIPEWTAAALLLTGFVGFAAASAFLSFTLRPTGTLTFAFILLGSCFVVFRLSAPFLNPHSWTLLLALLSILVVIAALLILLIGFIRWIRARRLAQSE
ncbi:MAG TPA: hypothetical protein VGG58_03180 [Candidatus Acidoferrum sp.]